MSNCPTTLTKRSNTLLEKFGVTHFSKSTLYKDKFKQTCLDRYGVINPGQIQHLKVKRAKAKSQTFITNLIANNSQYLPKFSVIDFGGVYKSTDWHCTTCESQFTLPNLIRGVQCPECYPQQALVGESKQEIQIAEWIQSLGVTMERKNRQILGKKEIDIWLPDNNLAIEICGSYWHSDRFVPKQYHQDKMINCEDKGIQLITLFDFDLKNSEIVNDMLLHKLGRNNKPKFNPRQGVLLEIDGHQAKQFNIQYHLRAHAAATYHFGFFVDRELIAVSSWSKSRFDKQSNALELVRLCSKYPVRGILGKMTSHVSRTLGYETIHSYVDLRYGQGNSYLASGYNLVRTTKPGYWYVDQTCTCYHRSSFTKSKLKNMINYTVNKTEFEIMDDLGYHRIWDCGNRLYEWRA